MRAPAPAMIAASALLLTVFCGLNPLATIAIVLGSGIVIIGHWERNRWIGITGYLLTAATVLIATDIPTITNVWMISIVGVLFVLPLSLLLWCVLRSGALIDEGYKPGASSYGIAAAFATIALLSVSLVGFISGTSILDTDVGETTQIMIIVFVSAMLSAVLLGVERKEK